jgi:hypothetical protein
MTPTAEDGFVVRVVELERALILGDPTRGAGPAGAAEAAAAKLN